MVVSPNGTQFLVDVKGQYKDNHWPISVKKKATWPLFYILAFVPDPEDGDGQNRFTVLTLDDVTAHLAENNDEWRVRKPGRADKNDPMPCVSSKYAKAHRGGWQKLPQ